jgi:ABC-type transport system involved in multi-copper enzyme maturation permease subunit
MGVWIMAGVTFREAARRKITWAALLAGAAFLILFATGMHFQANDLTRYKVAPFVRYQVQSSVLQVGFYAVDMLAVLLAILTSVDALSGEIASGTIQAIATKPVSRWQILLGKWIGFACMVAVYVALIFAGVATVGRVVAGIATPRVLLGGLLVYLECLLMLTMTFAFGTWFSTLTNGVIVIGLHGLAFIGGWIEQIAAFTNSPHLVTVGIVSSLLMPSEALWHRASFEMQSPVARTLQFTPFSNASAPSGAMIAYAAAYLLVAFAIAFYHFGERDL